MVAMGPVPPPEKPSEEGTATGATVPSAAIRRVASTFCQFPEEFFTRSGASEVSVVSVPPGVAKVCELAVVSASMRTRFPSLLARAFAAPIADDAAEGGGVFGVGQDASAGPCPRASSA